MSRQMRSRYLKGKDGKRYECSPANARFLGNTNGVSIYEFNTPSTMYAGFAYNGFRADLLYHAGMAEWKDALNKGVCTI